MLRESCPLAHSRDASPARTESRPTVSRPPRSRSRSRDDHDTQSRPPRLEYSRSRSRSRSRCPLECCWPPPPSESGTRPAPACDVGDGPDLRDPWDENPPRALEGLKRPSVVAPNSTPPAGAPATPLPPTAPPAAPTTAAPEVSPAIGRPGLKDPLCLAHRGPRCKSALGAARPPMVRGAPAAPPRACGRDASASIASNRERLGGATGPTQQARS
mmetsp:Transcript_25305/g.88315  ORF Transcript_25305/g.88315 Transcript_25305/m.88315 type:complete len:215 (-) Transcript_25305:238-882(-)